MSEQRFHVLEMLDQPKDYWLHRYFCRDGVQPTFSQHGEVGEHLCITWDDSEVTIQHLHEIVKFIGDNSHRQIRLLTDVTVPPHWLAPDMLDNGTEHTIWNEGISLLETWEGSKLLPAETVREVRRLLKTHVLSQTPEIEQREIEGQTGFLLKVGMTGIMRSRSQDDYIYEALEGTSTESTPIRVEIFTVDPLDRFRRQE